MYCSRCGVQRLPGDIACRYCGLGSYQPKNNRTRVAVTLSFVLLGCVALAWCFKPGGFLGSQKTAGNLKGLAANGKIGTPSLQADGSMGIATTELSGEQAQALLAAQGDRGITDLAVQGENPTPMLQANGTQPTPQTPLDAAGMPDDIRKWLEHLARIEQQRNAISGKQLGEAASEMAHLQASGGSAKGLSGLAEGDENAIPDERDARTGEVSGQTSTMRQSWIALQRDFASLPPPAECATIASNYQTVLRETASMMVEIMDALKKSQTDPNGAISVLMGMQGQSKSRIGVPARAADGFVGDVCSRYKTTKWFDIQSDIGSGLLGRTGM